MFSPSRPSFHATTGSGSSVGMMWAGSRLSNRLCQSEKGSAKVTVTVLPSSEPSTDSISS